MKRLKISDSDIQQITEAVRSVEKRTSAEIVVAITPRAGSYAFHELVFSLFFVLAVSLWLLIAPPYFMQTAVSLSWGEEMLLMPESMLLAQLAALLCSRIFLLFPALRFRIIPGSLRRAKVRRRAEAAFTRNSIGSTAGATGILVYIAVFERRVELLTDTAIQNAMPECSWQPFVDGIITGIRQQKFIDALIEQLIQAGALLAEKFPVAPDDVNELPDIPVIESAP